jgi:hypothetical protein
MTGVGIAGEATETPRSGELAHDPRIKRRPQNTPDPGDSGPLLSVWNLRPVTGALGRRVLLARCGWLHEAHDFP